MIVQLDLRTWSAVLALILLLIALGGCGGDEGTGEAELSRAVEEERQARLEARNARVVEEFERRNEGGVPTEEEIEAGRVTARFYEVLAAERGDLNRTTLDSSAFCDLMSDEAVEETIRYARVASGLQRRWDCEAAVEYFVIRSKRRGNFRQARQAKVLGVETKGDHGVATVKFGKGPATAVPLVREDGEWKLASSGTATTHDGG